MHIFQLKRYCYKIVIYATKRVSVFANTLFVFVLVFYVYETKSNATIDINLIKILSAGPEVSLKGSPTVSPTTAAL